jgi:hypothetical protein
MLKRIIKDWLLPAVGGVCIAVTFYVWLGAMVLYRW